jgi:MoaA/NifB/PqqE/SkfB family radical SAM enzyme
MNSLFTKLFDDTKNKNILYYVHWELTDSCNYKCPHCYLPKKQKYVDIEYALNFITELKNSSVFSVTLSGGEPLLHPHFSEIYVELKKAGILVDIITNASLIDDSIIDLFQKYPPKLLKISLYGTNNDNYRATTAGGSFDKFDKNIKLLKKNNIKFILQFSLTTLTYPYLDEYENYCKKYEVSYDIGTMIRPMIDGNKENLTTRLPAQTIINYNASQPGQIKKWKNTI